MLMKALFVLFLGNENSENSEYLEEFVITPLHGSSTAPADFKYLFMIQRLWAFPYNYWSTQKPFFAALRLNEIIRMLFIWLCNFTKLT